MVIIYIYIYIWSFSVAIENHHAMNRSASFCNIYEWFIFHMKFRHVYRSHLETVRHIDAESSVSRMLVCWMMYLRFPSSGVQLFEKNLSGAWYIYIYMCVCMVIIYIYIWLLYIYIIGHLDDEERGKMIIHGKSMKSQKKPMAEAVPLMVLLVGNNGNIKKKSMGIGQNLPSAPYLGDFRSI